MGLTTPSGFSAITSEEQRAAIDKIDRDKKTSTISADEKSLMILVHGEIEKRAEAEKDRENKRIMAINNPSVIAHELKRRGFQFPPGAFEALTKRKAI